MLECGCEGVGDDFSYDAVDCVADSDWASVFDEEGEVFGKEVEETEVETFGRGDAGGELVDDVVNDLCYVFGKVSEE